MTDVASLLGSNVFDADWYRQFHSLGSAVGPKDLHAAEHFLKHGLSKGLDPAPHIDMRFHVDLHGLDRSISPAALLRHMIATHASGEQKSIDHTRLPWALDRLARRGKPKLALQIAGRHLPEHLLAFGHILAANAALTAEDSKGWLAEINAYFACHQLTAITGRPFDPNILGSFGSTPEKAVNDGPLISVILSAWQASATVEASLLSILRQGWRSIEVIAVDDASTDGTGCILQRLADQDARVRVLRNPVNVGPYVSRNIALKLAQGAWICCHDADEWAHPDRFVQHMEWLMRQQEHQPISQTGMLRLTATGRISQIDRVGRHTVDGALRPCPSATTFDAAFLKNRLGAWDCARFGADSEMIARAESCLGRHATLFPKPLVLSLDHPDSLTNRPDTGTGGGRRLSPARASYRKFWLNRLAARQFDRDFHLPFPPVTDPGLPLTASVRMDDIAKCLAAATTRADGSVVQK